MHVAHRDATEGDTMNVRQLAVLARELAHFCASVTHLANTLHNEKRDATPDEIAPLHGHDSRVMLAMTGTDPNTIAVPQPMARDRIRGALNTIAGKSADPAYIGGQSPPPDRPNVDTPDEGSKA